MPRPKRTLAEADPNAQGLVPKRPSKGKEKATEASRVTSNTDRTDAANLEPNNAASENANTQPKFLSICRPLWDVAAEKHDKGEDDEDEPHDERDMCAADCVCKHPANDRPGWTWVLSEAGLKMYEQLEKEAFNRDQDEHGLYIYNDYTAYGINEVLDNWLKDFNKEISKRTVALYDVWARLESLSMFLQSDYIDTWFNGDDSHGFAETIALIGRALLTGLHLLRHHQLIKPDQPGNGGLRNISMVLALFLEFSRSWTEIGDDQFGETKWVPKVVQFAKENNIEIKGPYKFYEHNKKILEPEPDDGKPKERRKKVHFSEGTWGIATLIDIDTDDDELSIKDDGDYSVKGWKKAFKTYANKHCIVGSKTIGGTQYDLTKMSKAERKRLEEKEDFDF